MRVTTRSQIETYQKCRRRAFYRFLYRGKGLESARYSLDLVTGIVLHKGMEVLLKTSSLEEAEEALHLCWNEHTAGKRPQGNWTSDQARDYAIDEAHQLSRAFLLGWYRVVWASFVQRYEIVSVEEEAVTDLAPDVRLLSRWDFIVRDRITGLLYIGNWKTQASFMDWPRKWESDVQLWTESIAAEEKLGERITGTLMGGFLKGSLVDGARLSWLIRPYYHEAEGLLSAETERRKGWERVAIWKRKSIAPDPLRYWIEERFDPEDLRRNFYLTDPIFKNDSVVEKWVRQVVRMEQDSSHVLETGSIQEQEDYFAQSFSDWNCSGCTFREICFGSTSPEGLLDNGTLVERIEHHSPVPLDNQT